METSLKKPVLVIGYKRPELTAAVLTKVKQYGPSRLYLACDLEENGDGLATTANQDVRRIMSSFEIECPKEYFFSSRKLGLSGGPPAAISWFFSLEPNGIILEDDCLPSEHFFHFSELLLERFIDEPKIWGISGSNANGIDFGPYSYGFVRIPQIWGWASWADRWRKYDQSLSSFTLRKVLSQRVWPSQDFTFALLRHLVKQKIKPFTWDYQLFWSMLLDEGVWVVSSVNLIRNEGLTGESSSRHRISNGGTADRALGKIAHPEGVLIDELAEQRILTENFGVKKHLVENVLISLGSIALHSISTLMQRRKFI